MGRHSIAYGAELAAKGGGPPLPLPVDIDDLEPILARWPMLLRYEPETGDLLRRYTHDRFLGGEFLMIREQWLATKRSSARGRNFVQVDGFRPEAARVVWLLHHGAWPAGRLGRRDGDNFNDRIENLFVMETEPRGKPGRTRSRPAGVARLHDRWQAYAPLPNGRRKHLGVHLTEEAAIAARARWDAAQDLV